ncbi:MAG: sterol desaturase family protein [Polaribacter sp.]|jgi:sterol desaturase/sphingolipid hydroxylase (fatty acid hydroxylase superfamily)|nr:sterol desaturase family protein [Polaribacter sp.]MDG1953701.1 sterol desaturase family protein [Polaribacter sp.]
MENYLEIFTNTVVGMANYQWKQIIFEVPWNENWFWGLTIISLLVWGLELLFPWRKNQKAIRRDFWLDWLYMYLNFFIFQIGLFGLYDILGSVFNNFGITSTSFVLIEKSAMPTWAFILIFFILNDFVQWFTHVLLHKFEFLWKFHKVHHSVKEMGFAAHLRYHWMENIFYKPLKTLAVMVLVGAEPEQAFFIHFFAVLIGHLNHANVRITWGPLKYIFNNSVMHLYHHVKALPEGKPNGINFGISLSIWDYIFKTNYVPEDSGTIELGFPEEESFPQGLWGQVIYGFGKSKK